MSAKKRGPGRPPKSKNKKPAATAVHTVPSHFWSQVGAILLAVITAMLVAGLFGMGGVLPLSLANGVRWLVGWTAFIIPIVFAIQIVQVFRQPDSRIPAVIWVSTVMFVALFAGTFQLVVSDPTSLEIAKTGNGGGVIGWAVADLALRFVNIPIAGLIFVVLMLILLMFIFSISPKAVIDAIHDFIGSEESSDRQNEKVAATLADNPSNRKIKIGGLGSGEIEKEPIAGAETNKKAHRLLAKHNNEESEDKDKKPPKETKRELMVNAANKIEKADVEPVVINNSNWELPQVKKLSDEHREADPGNMQLRAQQIESTLAEFGIGGNVHHVNIGPRIAQYCLIPPRGVQLSKISSLRQELSSHLQVENLRIEAPIPGQSYVGIEVPNKKPASVSLRSILESEEWAKEQAPLAFAVGLNITGSPIVLDLASLPHLLVAGTTGSGKSVMMNVLVTSMLFRNTPDDVKFVLVDPKGNETSSYVDMPHLIAPIISGTSPEELTKLVKTVQWLTEEMDRRYEIFKDHGGVRNLADFNKRFPDEKMPYIVVVIDEYTDVMDSLKSTRPTDKEIFATSVQRIAQKGRAAGVHEVIMMQAPRAVYIQGALKANIPAGFAFAVANKRESIQIINTAGAETLMGQGDMLMLTQKLKNPRRVQSAFISDQEVGRIIAELKMQSGPQYDEALLARLSDNTPVNGGIAIHGGDNEKDAYYDQAVEYAIELGKISASLIQRRFRVGFNRGASMLDMMERNGIVGPQNGSKPREVLVSSLDELQSDEVSEE